MMKKKKQSRSQSSTVTNPKPSSDSSPSPSPRLLSIFRSKLASGKDLRHMFRGSRSKTAPGLSSQSKIVRCPKCHKLLQETIDATIYKCSGCDSVLQAKRWDVEGNDNRIPEALLLSQNRSLTTEVESGSKTPTRSTPREYNPRESPSVQRGYLSETGYKHETTDICREWMRRANEFSETGDGDVFASARISPYNSRSNASEWTQHEGRYKDLPRVPFYPASPSLSSAYEYGYTSPFHGSQVSASEKSYYHHQQPNQFNQYEREGWFQESSIASPIRFPGDGKYTHWSSQSQLHDLQYQNLYEPSSSATPHRSVYSERIYQAAAAPHRSTYSKSEASSEKMSLKDKKKYVKEKNPVVKRYVLPSVGGAPFATCSYCLELLHLPQVSPHGIHKRYQVRCGSCSGVLKFSVREKAETVLDSPSFVNSSTGFADETVITIHQDSASEGHEEIYPDGSHLSCSDNSSGDAIFKSDDDVILRPSLETFEDKAITENIRSISNKLLESELEKLQPQWKPESSETIGETSRILLKQCEEGHTEKSTEMDNNNILERVGCDLEESAYEKNEIVKPEEMFGDGSSESLEVTLHKDEMMSESSAESVGVAESPVSHRYKNEFDWEETQENEEYRGESKLEEIMGDNPEKSHYCGDSLCGSSSSDGETFEDKAVKEDREQISNEKQELDKTISDRGRYELEESRNETETETETFETVVEGEIGEERSVSYQMGSPNENVENSYERLEPVYLEGSGYAGERTWTETMGDRAGLHLEEYESNYESYSKPFESTSEEAPAFHMHEYELGTILEPEEDGQGRSESISRGSLDDHESSKDTAVFHESQDAKPDQSQYEYYDNSSERQELSNTDVDIVRSEIHECISETSEMFELDDMVGVGSVVSLEKASDTIICETGKVHEIAMRLDEYQRASTFRLHEYELGTMPKPEEDANGRSISSSTDIFHDHKSSKERAVAHEEEPLLVDENKTEELKSGVTIEDGPSLPLEKCGHDSTIMEETFKWTERTPTLSLYESKLRTMLEPDEDADERSKSSSTSSFNNNESTKVRALFHEEELDLMNDSRTEKLQKDKVTVDLDKGENESVKPEETFERASERPPTLHLHEYEPGTMLELNEDADSRAIQVSEMAKDTVPLHIEESKNDSMKIDEPFEWTSERALTFRLHEYELGTTMLEPDEDANGSTKERAANDEVEPWLVDDYKSKALRESVMAEDGPSQRWEKQDDEKMESEKTLELSDHAFRLNLDDTLEHERITFNLDMSQDKQENLRPILKQGDIEEDIPEFGSTVSSEDHKSQSKMVKVDSEAEEEISRDYVENLQKENEKSRLTSSPYAHLYNTTEASEIVGLRHALYQRQTSPLRSPLSSPIHTPIGSPLHYLMGSQMRSPIASPMHSHIVSPLRSPINTSGSLSDVLFFGKKP